MTGMLQQVQVSGAQVGARIVVVAAEKQGKTTFGCGAPDALLIPIEQGYGGVSVPMVPLITDWMQMVALQHEIVQQARSGQFPYRTLVIDSATALEALIHRFTIAQDPASKNNKALSMESSHGGYGKAYGVANNTFREFLAWCDMLVINAKMNIVLTAHCFSSKVKDPTAGEYDSMDVLLHSPKDQKTYGKREIITQWADVVGYLHEPVIVTQTNNVMQAISRGQGRVLAVERTPAYTAGNRYGMRGVIPIPAPPANGWNYFADALYKQTGNRIDLYNRKQP